MFVFGLENSWPVRVKITDPERNLSQAKAAFEPESNGARNDSLGGGNAKPRPSGRPRVH